MKNLFILILLLSVSVINIAAQDKRTKVFNLIVPENVIENSLYDNIEYLDSRLFKEDLGYVQTGMFNNYVYMVDEPSFAQQFDSLMSKVINETARQKTLLLQLRNLNFSEITKSMSETGYCHIRISLYEKEYPDYYLIATLDTLLTVKAMDVTGKLIKNSSNIITSFVLSNLTNKRTDEVPFLLADIHNIDFFEKNNMKLYSADAYVDGAYPDFKSFANQTPVADKLTPKFDKNNNLKEVKQLNEQNKLKKLNPKDIYAVVLDGQPYIASDKGYILIHKVKDEFKFLNDGNIRIDAGAYVGAGIAAVAAGLLGGIVFIPVNNRVEQVEMTIDHLNGHFIILPDMLNP
ncbi:MAG: hypothetical protein ACK5KT_00780 [Dysgonomonas sp.]